MEQMIGFKEWQVVCDALESGRQTLIFRKGGIHEGRKGFSFAHDSFFLFPTRFHTTPNEVREGVVTPLPEWTVGEEVVITHHAEVLWAKTLVDWDVVKQLEEFHIYSEKIIRDRFDWQQGGMVSGSIHAALVRVRSLLKPWAFPYEAKYGGCRSWVNLPPPPEGWDDTMVPVLGDADFLEISKRCQL